jgi:hypothetical protein
LLIFVTAVLLASLLVVLTRSMLSDFRLPGLHPSPARSPAGEAGTDPPTIVAARERAAHGGAARERAAHGGAAPERPAHGGPAHGGAARERAAPERPAAEGAAPQESPPADVDAERAVREHLYGRRGRRA